VANDHYILDYPEDDPEDAEDADSVLQGAIEAFLRSTLVDYLAVTLNRPPTVSEARDMADQAQALLLEVDARGWGGV
jgi:hypothetical protein